MRPRRLLLPALATALAACAATGPDLQALPTLRPQAVAVYQCYGNERLTVAYLHGDNGQSLAWLAPPDSAPLLFAATLSASGVRYQAERFVWWTKGAHGDLYDQTRGDDAAPVLADCRQQGNP